MSGRPWRLAVAGCGAAAFGLHLPVLAARPDFDVVAAFDREPGRAEAAARKFGIPAVAGTPGDLLRDADMLVVLTGVHDSLIEAGLAAGRHVFTEKPVTLDIARTRQLRQQAQAAGLLLEVGAMRAFDPALHALIASVPAPSGGWLLKADGADAAARRRILPGGFAPYTYAADPPPALPAGLDATQAAALKTLLWEGYHLLTALVLAVPAAVPVMCAVGPADGAVHATAADAAGLYTIVVGRPPAGEFTEQVRLHGPDASATLGFPLPYTPGQPACLTTAGATSETFADPFACMWAEVSRHLAGEHPAAGSAAIAEQVEQLALGLALTARPTPEGARRA